MTREPFRLGGSPVNNIKGMKKYLFAAGKLDFPEFYRQWDSLIQFIKTDTRTMGAEMLPVMLRQRYEYLEYILECVKSDSMKGNLTADIFSEKNQSGLKTEVRELSALFAEIRTSSLRKDTPKETDLDYPYWICAKNRDSVFKAVAESNIADNKKQWIYYILTALYSRLGIIYDDCPAEMPVLELFLNGESGQKEFSGYMTQVLTKEEKEIEVLPLGNNEPYILPAAKGVEAYRNENLVCKHLYRRKATTNIPVTVCFCEDARPEKELGRIVLSEGEYRDVLINSKGNILRVLPYVSRNRNDVIIRPLNSGTKLMLYRQTEREAPDLEQRPEKEWTEEQCMDITSFAADGKGGFLAVKKGKILSDYVEEDMIYYDPQLEIERDRGTDVVEVWIEDGCYFYLKADGNVFGNGTVSESVYNREIVSEEK